MLELDEQGFDVSFHADAAALTSIVPLDVDASKLVPSHVKLNSVNFFEKIQEVVEVFDPNIFDTKVVYDQTELNGAPFVMPKSWCGRCFIITLDDKARAEEIVCEDPGLRKAIAALADFIIYPAIAVPSGQVVFLNELSWNV